MIKISDLVDIKKENFFNGAIQAEWFYDNEKRKKVSESYIFHGPKYYGVSKKDIDSEDYKLSDTVTFTEAIYNKIYNDNDSSRFMMTIAGYGAGKSHLSVALATLLSNLDSNASDNILEGIKQANVEGYELIKKYENDKHLVLVLNGINDFNLNMEILKVAKETLKLHGLDENIFDDMSLAYKTAKTFLENTFKYIPKMYLDEAKKYTKFKNYNEEQLLNELKENVENYEAYSIINAIYKTQTGNEISINEGISASNILNKLHKKYVVEEKLFKSVIIFFDEFGRYLEFASSQPSIAGETGLQQLFEAVQNAAPSMIFVGFIQSDLNAYMSRVNNDNIIRYVGRYQISDKYYLSSNLETVIASLVKKKDNSEKIIENIFDNTLSKYFSSGHKNILRWITENNNKNVWTSYSMFSKTILKGSYPIHPLTISLLSTLSSYMQQRSTLTFLSDIFDSYKNKNLDENIPFIYPTAIINSPIFDEILNAEERGRVSGQNCLQYSDVLEQSNENLNYTQKCVLSSILVMNLAKYKIFDKDDCIKAIEATSGLSNKSILEAIKHLETDLGIIFYDSAINRFNFISEGNSKVDFNKLLFKYRMSVNKNNILDSMPEDSRIAMKLEQTDKTNFGIIKNIVTNEWGFNRFIVDINDFTESYAKTLLDNFDKAYGPDEAKGKLIYIYCDNSNYAKVTHISNIIKLYNLSRTPILIGLLYDKDSVIKESLLIVKALNKFSENDKEKFSKFYDRHLKEQNTKIVRYYSECARCRQYITEDGLIVANMPVQKEMVARFENIYTKTIPFVIDSFETKVTPKSRKYYNSIIESFISGKLEDNIEFKNLPIDVKNRINTMLSINSEKGWKVFYNEGTISVSQNKTVREIAEEVLESIKISSGISINNIVNKYRKPPYGLNKYSIALLIIYIIVLNKNNIIIKNSTGKIRLNDLKLFFDEDKKEKFSSFFACQLVYTEENTKDEVLLIIENIEKNRFVPIDKALELYESLSKIDDMDVPIELRGRFIGCKDSLLLAKKKSIEINSDLQECKNTIPTLVKNPARAKKILEVCDNIKDGNINGSTYMYSLKQIEDANKIKDTVLNNLVKLIKEFNQNNSFDERCKAICILISKYLKMTNRDELAEEIENILLEIKKKAEEKNKLKVIIGKLRNETFEIEKSVKLLENLEEAEAIIEKWENNKEKLLKVNIESINSSYEKIEKYKNQIKDINDKSQNIILKIEEDIEDINSISMLQSLIKFVSESLNEKILVKQRNIIIEIENALRDIVDVLSKYEYSRYTKIELNKTIEKLEVKYKDKNIILKLIKSLKLYFESKYNTFVSDYKGKYSIEIEDLNIQNLKKLLNDAKLDLEYLDDECSILYNSLENKINKKLNVFKIENILSIFSELDEDEKTKCLDILKTI